MAILTADWHLTADPDEEYRWDVVNSLLPLFDEDRTLYILGDLADRRDRHPSDLVNRLVDTFTSFGRMGIATTILCGNHDRPLHGGKPYWSFLSSVPNVRFIREPTAFGSALFLPYSANPPQDWDGIDFSLYRVGFMHQSAHGADIGHGQTYQKGKDLAVTVRRDFRFYSGDIHHPQTLGRITYVGAPHHVRYGDEHACRFLIIDDKTYEVVREVPLAPPSKHVLSISSAEDLRQISTNRGDMARVRLVMPLERIADWPAEQAAISSWAREKGIAIAGIEPIVETAPTAEDVTSELSDPLEVLAAFGDAANIDEDLMQTGFDLIEQAKGIV